MPAGGFFHNGPDKLDVFLRLDAAGGINEAAAGFEKSEHPHEQSALGVSDDAEEIRIKAPPDIDPAAENTGVRAGNVKEDAVESFREALAEPCGLGTFL